MTEIIRESTKPEIGEAMERMREALERIADASGKWMDGYGDLRRVAAEALAAAPSVAIGAREVEHIPLPCPFCGQHLVRNSDDDDPFWEHKDRQGKCWLAKCWVADRLENGILEWNTRAVAPAGTSIPADVEREEALREALKPFAMIAPHVEHTDKRDGDVVHRQAIYLGSGYMELTKNDFRRAAAALAARPSTPQAPC